MAWPLEFLPSSAAHTFRAAWDRTPKPRQEAIWPGRTSRMNASGSSAFRVRQPIARLSYVSSVLRRADWLLILPDTVGRFKDSVAVLSLAAEQRSSGTKEAAQGEEAMSRIARP